MIDGSFPLKAGFTIAQGKNNPRIQQESVVLQTIVLTFLQGLSDRLHQEKTSQVLLILHFWFLCVLWQTRESQVNVPALQGLCRKTMVIIGI